MLFAYCVNKINKNPVNLPGFYVYNLFGWLAILLRWLSVARGRMLCLHQRGKGVIICTSSGWRIMTRYVYLAVIAFLFASLHIPQRLKKKFPCKNIPIFEKISQVCRYDSYNVNPCHNIYNIVVMCWTVDRWIWPRLGDEISS